MSKKILSLIAICFLIIVYNFETNLKKRIGFLNYDLYQNIFEEDFSTNKVVIVDIDEKSIEKIGQFPWRRDVYSTILENLNTAEVSAIAFDIFFSEEDTQNPVKIFKEFNLNSENILNSDELFLGSIKNSNVILPLVGATKEVKKNNFSPKANIITKGEDPLNYLYNYQGYISSLDKIFSIIFACTCTPGTILPVGILTKSKTPSAEDPIKTILFFKFVLSKLFS